MIRLIDPSGSGNRSPLATSPAWRVRPRASRRSTGSATLAGSRSQNVVCAPCCAANITARPSPQPTSSTASPGPTAKPVNSSEVAALHQPLITMSLRPHWRASARGFTGDPPGSGGAAASQDTASTPAEVDPQATASPAAATAGHAAWRAANPPSAHASPRPRTPAIARGASLAAKSVPQPRASWHGRERSAAAVRSPRAANSKPADSRAPLATCAGNRGNPRAGVRGSPRRRAARTPTRDEAPRAQHEPQILRPVHHSSKEFTRYPHPRPGSPASRCGRRYGGYAGRHVFHERQALALAERGIDRKIGCQTSLAIARRRVARAPRSARGDRGSRRSSSSTSVIALSRS